MAANKRTDHVERLVEAWRRELPAAVNPKTELSKRLLLLGAELSRALQSAAQSNSLTAAEHEVLAALRRRGTPYEAFPTALAADLLLSSGGISNVLTRLEDRGLVRREPSGGDGRRRAVRLTPKGRKLGEASVLTSNEAQAAVLAGLDDGDVARLTEILRGLESGRAGRS